MKIHADHYFTGKTPHKPCEDYAVSGLTPVPHVILADGCSSSPGSHVGAMLLALSARSRILADGADKNWMPDYHEWGKQVIEQAGQQAEALSLPLTVLDATLITAIYLRDRVRVHVYGDGLVAALPRDGSPPLVHEIRFETNAPYYLSYLLDNARDEAYRQEMNRPQYLRINNQEVEMTFDTPIELEFPAEKYFWVAAASDGAGAFVRRESPQDGPLPADDILAELTAFKNYAGEFVKRRAKRAMKTFDKRGLALTDDLSFGCIHMEATP